MCNNKQDDDGGTCFVQWAVKTILTYFENTWDLLESLDLGPSHKGVLFKLIAVHNITVTYLNKASAG